jgi:hypothetical protein
MNNLFQNLSTSDSEGDSPAIKPIIAPDDGFTKVNNLNRKNRGRGHQRGMTQHHIESPITKIDNSDNENNECTKNMDNIESNSNVKQIANKEHNVDASSPTLSPVSSSSLSLSPKDIKLESKWRYWTHERCKEDWGLESYNKLIVMGTVGEFWKVFNNIDKLNGLGARYYFMMRGEIDPIWEHPKNRNGIIWSVQVQINQIDAVWQRLCTLIVGESFLPPSQTLLVNGISTVLREVTNNGKNGGTVGSKETFYLIKIWLFRNIDIQKNIIAALKDISSLRDMSIRPMQLRPEW